MRPQDYLQPGEKVLLAERRHPLSIVDGLLVAFVLMAVLGTAGTLLVLSLPVHPAWVAVPLVLAAIVGGSLAAVQVRRMQTSLYILTPERVYAAVGKLRFSVLQTTHDKVTDLHVSQGIFGRRRGFGTVRVATAGAHLVLAGVRDPFAVKQAVEAARTAFLATLVAAARRQAKAQTPAAAKVEAAQAQAASTATVWEAKPSSASLLGRGLVSLMQGLLGFALIGGAMAGPDQLGFLGAFLVLGATATAISAVVDVRYTRFTVTGGGVVVARGWLRRHRVETTFDKVTDVTTQQDLLGRLLGYGTISINTAGGPAAAVVFRGVAQPEQVKALIDQVRGTHA